MLELFDAVPIGPLMMVANELRGHVRPGQALAGMIYLHMRRVREDTLTAREADRNQAKLVNASEAEKGRAPFHRGAHRTSDEKIAIGRQLLDNKASLPCGHFGPWLQASGLADRAAQRLARNAAD